ncbi:MULTISPECIES: hypothetical protein [unclassified Agrococcus]|uniref:hypothetical protein n=1 Tax=unclassified Agrococcus TaxID=2615065 RepID=UPI00360CDD67
MNPDERPEQPAAGPSLVPNLDAQRAYAASIAPPPKPPLPQEMMRRARLAGGVGGAAMLLGVELVGVGIALLLSPLVVGSVVRWLASMQVDVDASASPATVAALSAGPWPWIGSLLVLVGVAGVVAGSVVSVRTLRAAGFPRPARLTLGAFGIAFGARVAFGIFTAPFSSLLTPLLERGVAGLSADGVELVGTIVAFVVLALMNVAIAAATGMVAWWMLANATRPPAEVPDPEPPAWAAVLERHDQPS